MTARLVKLVEVDRVCELLHRAGHRGLSAHLAAVAAAHVVRCSARPAHKGPKTVPYRPLRPIDSDALTAALLGVRHRVVTPTSRPSVA